MLRALLPLLLAPAFFTACAANERLLVVPMEKHAREYQEFQFAPAVRVGDTVYVSGIPAGPGATFEEKARSAFRRLGEILSAAGASMDDVVEITTFHAAPKDTAAFLEEFKALLPIHRDAFHGSYPAWTAVGTTTLLSAAPFEMRAVAVIGAGKRTRIVREVR